MKKENGVGDTFCRVILTAMRRNSPYVETSYGIWSYQYRGFLYDSRRAWFILKIKE